MTLSALVHPFARLRRLPFLGALFVTLALGYGGLYALRFGGEISFLGLAVFVLSLWMLLSTLCNRTRDADASAGWLLFPVLVTVVSMYIAVSMGYVDFSDFVLPNATRADRIVSAPFRPFIMVISAFIPMLIAMLVSGFFWLLSFLVLAVLPSRPAKR